MKMNKKQEKQEKKLSEKEQKKRYLNDTAAQLEMLKWILILITLAFYDMKGLLVVALIIISITDWSATKWCFDDIALKMLMMTLILSSFIVDISIINVASIAELLIVIIISITGYYYLNIWKEYRVLNKRRGDYNE